MNTDEKWHRIGLIRELSSPGGLLSNDGPYASINNPQWYRNGTKVDDRRALHNMLISEVVEGNPLVRQERRALVLAGPPGAGKGSVAQNVLGEELKYFINIDADHFKERLLQEAIKDGSYETWFKSEELRQLEAQGEKFYPMELASLVHEESSKLAGKTRDVLIGKGSNIVIDAVLGREGSATKIFQQLKDAGYKVEIVDVEVPLKVSEERIVMRWEHAIEQAQNNENALGGRWVPSSFAKGLFNTAHGRSLSQDVAQKMAHQFGNVEKFSRYFTSKEEHANSLRQNRPAQPVLEVSQKRQTINSPLQETIKLSSLLSASFPTPANQAATKPKHPLTTAPKTSKTTNQRDYGLN